MLRWATRASDVLITIWIADAHRDGKRFVVRGGEKLTAFMELEAAIRACRELATAAKSADYFRASSFALASAGAITRSLS
jgi:hypothetical protein